MQYQFVSTSDTVTTLNWLILFQPDVSNPDQTVRSKAMTWTGSVSSFPVMTIDPTTQTYNNGAPSNKNGTIMLVPVELDNLADPAKGHNNQDTKIAINTTSNNTDINDVAWIAAHDPNNSDAPRMPKLQATIGAPSGCKVLWKLQVIFHDRFGNSHRDFDTGPVQDTAVAQDTVTIPKATGSADPNVESGWHKVTDGTPWNIYDNPDWTSEVATGFFGGDAVLSVKVVSSDGSITILPQMDWKFRIAGENPDPTKCKANILSVDPGKWWAYAIAKHETKFGGGRTYYNQFSDNGGKYSTPAPGKEGKPYWNNDGTTADPVSGSGGYGLFQLTYDSTDANFKMPRGWIWNWQQNVQQGISDIEGKVDSAITYVSGQRTHAVVGGVSVPVPKLTTSREANPDSGDDDTPHVPPTGQPMTMVGGDSIYGYPTATATVSFYDTTTISSGHGELIEVAQSIKAYNGLSGGNYVSWNGSAWQFNRSRTDQAHPGNPPKDNKSYVDLVSIEIEASENHAVSP